MPDFVPNVILPERFRDANVIVVGSPEHQELLKSAENAKQAKIELEHLKATKELVDEQLRKNEEIQSNLIKKNQDLEIDVRDKRATILKLYMVIGGLTLVIVGLLKFKFF